MFVKELLEERRDGKPHGNTGYRQKESLREISAEKSKLSQEAEIKAEEKKEAATNEAKSQQNANAFVSKEQKNLQNKLKKIEEKIYAMPT